MDKQQALTDKKLLLRLLDRTEQQYEDMIFERAYEYLDSYLNGDQDGARILTASRYFWKWWAMHWATRNRRFICDFMLEKIDHVISPSAIRMLREEYDLVHSVASLKIYPNRIVLDQSYAVMVGEMIDNEHNRKQ